MNRVRYLDKSVNNNERENYSLWWKEQIEHYGTEVTYFSNKLEIAKTNAVYSEQSTAGYENKGTLIIASSITNDSIILAKFGVQADCDMTAVIHISAFYEAFGANAEPKSGDLIEMTEYGNIRNHERPNGRGAAIYEITERDDEYLQMTNPLAGHYVWYIKCRRFEYSYEDGITPEPANNQISDNSGYGKLPIPPTDQEFTKSVDDFAAELLFDYKKNDLRHPYGNY